MICEDIQRMISAYADDSLGTKAQGSMFTHLAGCADCREFFRSILELKSRFASLPVPEVPPSLDKRVLRLSPGRAGRPAGARDRFHALWSHRLSVPLPSAALIALALITATVISISLWQRPEVVTLPCLPAIDVYAVPSANPPTIE
jgi:anti-sigma factor RsiW